MTMEARELYVYTVDHFADDIKQIRPTCVAPLVAVRQVVQRAMIICLKEYCSYIGNLEDNTVFSEGDYQAVSNKICEELK